MSGGSSQPSNTTTTTTTELPDVAQPLLGRYLNQSEQIASTPYQPYEGQRIAGLTPEHQSALDMTTNRALAGSPAVTGAQQNAADSFSGKYMDEGLGIANQNNPYMGQANPYSGQNPYLQSMIDQSSQDVMDNYNKTVNPQLAAMDRASGAFGNSGVQEMRSDSQQNLARELGNVSSGLRFQDYGQQAQLAESGLSRDATLAAQQQANQLNVFNNERNNQMASMEFAPQLAESDYRDAQALLGVGDIYRDDSQQNLNFNYDQWQQAQNYPYQQLDVLANALRTSVGAGGSSVMSAPNAYSSNSTANMLGTGLMGYGALDGLGLFG